MMCVWFARRRVAGLAAAYPSSRRIIRPYHGFLSPAPRIIRVQKAVLLTLYPCVAGPLAYPRSISIPLTFPFSFDCSLLPYASIYSEMSCKFRGNFTAAEVETARPFTVKCHVIFLQGSIAFT